MKEHFKSTFLLILFKVNVSSFKLLVVIKYFSLSRRGSRGGEMGEFSPPPPFSEPPSFFFFLIPQTPQPGFGSTKIHPPFQNPGSAPALH